MYFKYLKGQFVVPNQHQWLVGHTVDNKHQSQCSGLVGASSSVPLFSKLSLWQSEGFCPAVVNKPYCRRGCGALCLVLALSQSFAEAFRTVLDVSVIVNFRGAFWSCR